MVNNSELKDINIADIQALPTPSEYEQLIPLSENQRSLISTGRKAIVDIISGHDNRLMIVVGPCSIHDIKAGREYASKLKTLSDQISSRILS